MTDGAARGVFFGIELFGLVALPILAFTCIFSSSVKRHPTVANNAIVWTLNCLVGCLLLFTGQLDNPEPPYLLCHAQSALMLGGSAAVSTAGVCLIWKVWSLTWRLEKNSAVVEEPWWLTCILLGLPYLVWGVQAVVFAVLQTGTHVHPVTFYCTSDDPNLGVISSVLAAIALGVYLIFQIWTAVLVFSRFRKSTRNRLGRHELGRHVTVPFFIRTLVFMVMVITALTLAFIATAEFSLEVPDIIIACCGVVTFFIFASQRDVLVCWHLVSPGSGSTETRMTGSEINSESQPKHEPTGVHPSAIGVSLDPSQCSSVWDLHQSSKGVPHLAIRVDQIELTTRCDGKASDNKSLQSLEQCSSAHV
ncbi:hypothetical protein RhiLY_12499 [Ceratobasidium sp. AG-Ba]|nr:hypothetical protein RhiLY_12499 [Ceratobasidium sp. AG-Ba]